MKLKHELWEEKNGEELLFCLAGHHGEDARKSLSPDAKLIWMVQAEGHFEAMTKYYEFMGWGEYRTAFEQDKMPYPEEWSQS